MPRTWSEIILIRSRKASKSSLKRWFTPIIMLATVFLPLISSTSMRQTSSQTFKDQLQNNHKYKWNNPFVILTSGTSTWICNLLKNQIASKTSNQWSTKVLRWKRKRLMRCLQIHSKLSSLAPTKNKVETASKLLNTIIRLSYRQKNSRRQLFSHKQINQYKTIQRHPKVVRKFHLSAVDPSPNRIKAVQLQFSNHQLRLHKPLISLWMRRLWKRRNPFIFYQRLKTLVQLSLRPKLQLSMLWNSQDIVRLLQKKRAN